MGNSAFSSCGDATGHLQEDIAVEVDDATKQASAAIKKEVSEAAKDVKEQATQIAEATGEAVEFVADQVAELAEDVKEGAGELKEAAGQVAGLAEDVKEEAGELKEAAGQVAEAAKGATEQVISTIDAAMDAAVAAVTGNMIVDFADEKGAERQVTFKTRSLGFELGMSGGSCCGAKGQAKVVATKVTRGGLSEVLGVRRGWRVKSVNGVDVTGLAQAKKLLADHALKLPVA